jgi:hypothetical protein
MARSTVRDSGVEKSVHRIMAWYFERAYGRWEGPGIIPFYCDRQKVGHFAVRPADLAVGRPSALFRLFVGLAMFQARRDTLIMDQQRVMSRADAMILTSTSRLGVAIKESSCDLLRSAEDFEQHCDVRKNNRRATCSHLPRARCHVKDAAHLLNRMGDMGKLPTSAWLRLWSKGRLAMEIEEVHARELDPQIRADLLVEVFSRVFRVGRKLATMFVSALSNPTLAPGLTPWFPAVDGSRLLVIDTNVAQVVDALRGPRAKPGNDGRTRWLLAQATKVDLREFREDLPNYSPRLVQQAMYLFRSKSNRAARGDPCALGSHGDDCLGCVPVVCPFDRKKGDYPHQKY